jgi:hypothetical protein
MAGFDFPIPVRPDERDLARAVLRHLQRAARYRPCDRPTLLRYLWSKPTAETPYHHYYVAIDGDFAEIQAFAAAAVNDCYHFGEGFIAAKPQFRRSKAAKVVAFALLKRIMEFQNEMQELVGRLGEIGAALSPNSYLFAKSGCAAVDRSCGAASVSLINWRNGREPAATLAEQLHTAAEVSLKEVISAPNRGVPFAKLVSSAREHGVLNEHQAAALHKLKDLRRDSKHRGQGVSERLLADIVSLCVSSLHNIIASLKLRAANNSSKPTPLRGAA